MKKLIAALGLLLGLTTVYAANPPIIWGPGNAATVIPPVLYVGSIQPGGTTSSLYTPGAVPYVNASHQLAGDASNFFWDASNKRLGIGTSTPSSSLSLSGASAQTIQTERATSGAGLGLTLKAGGAQAGGTNLSGGDLTLAAGVSTGSGTSSINFQTSSAGSAGSSDNALSTKYSINPAGNISHVIPNATSVNTFVGDYYGPNNGSLYRYANGTLSSPTKTLTGNPLYRVFTYGYQETTNAFSSLAGSLEFYATQDFTSTATGTAFRIFTTPNNSTTSLSALVLDQDQSLLTNNFRINGNTIYITDTNGSLFLRPQGSGYVHQFATNNYGTYPVENSGLATGYNFTGGHQEIDMFNTLSGAATSFRFYQQTDDASATELLRMVPSGDISAVTGNLQVLTAGKGLQIKEGSDATMGTCTLSAGTCTVSTSAVTATSRIFLTSNADGGTPGWLRVSARTASTSFTVTSSSGTDTSTVAWIIFEPSS